MSLTMSRAEREEFLVGVHVGVLSVASGGGGRPARPSRSGTPTSRAAP